MQPHLLLIALAGCVDGLPVTAADPDSTLDDGSGTTTDEPADPDIDPGSTDAPYGGPFEWPDGLDIRVCVDGSADYVDLQPAIDASVPGDTIGVCPGIYGPISVPWSFDVALTAVDGPGTTTIDGGAGPAVIVRDGALRLTGFHVTGTGVYDPWYPEAAAFSVHEGTVTIEDCRVDGTTGPFALLFDENTLVMRDVVWEDNATDYLWYLYEGTSAEITGNIVRGGIHQSLVETEDLDRLTLTGSSFAESTTDTAMSAFVLHSNGSGPLSVTNNVFYDLDDLEPWGGRVFEGDADLRNNIVVGCDAWNLHPVGSSWGIWWDNGVDYGPSLDGSHNLFVDPMFTDAAGGDFSLQPGSPAIDAGDPSGAFNDVDGSRNDVGMFGGH